VGVAATGGVDRIRDRPAVAVVLAGGTGTRMATEVPKQLLELAGRPMLEYSIAAFDAAPGIDRVLLVMAPGFRSAAERIVAAGPYRKVRKILDGGATRTDSTRRALAALRQELAGEWDVLFHDAARPLVDRQTIADCLAVLRTAAAITVAMPTSDTILEVDDGLITDIPNRHRLWRCQTPQGFRLATLQRAYELADADVGAGFQATDDCSVVLRYLPGVPIAVVPGSTRNLKVTEPADLAMAEALLA
jgi:2-C-methyl-D-erythritol 4-phosphate cytidylyltransferase